MHSSTQSSQLEIWRIIVTQRHDPSHPLSKHVDFIRNRVQELEFIGFDWTKNSILDILYKIGLPTNAEEFPVEVDTSTETALRSRNEVEERTRAIESPLRRRPASFVDLPVEIIQTIIGHLILFAQGEADALWEKRQHARTLVPSRRLAKQPHCACFHPIRTHVPLLNTFQSFAVVSRGIYKLCRPWLWKALKFPTCLPVPLDFWTKGLLPQHSQCIRSLSMDVSTDCCGDRSGSEDRCASQFLLLDSVMDLLSLCSELDTLEIRFQRGALPPSEIRLDKTTAFFIQLIPRLSNLEKLRHLKMRDMLKNGNMQYCFPQLLESLPLLESLEINGFSSTIDYQRKSNKFHTEKSLGKILSKMKHLSTLRLINNEDINDSWTLYPWSASITNLFIDQFPNFDRGSVLEIVNHIAPKLICLDIRSNRSV
ncbi:hypothetical protein CROQUDRAFT_49331 [Cronartium quercuum f. sp. fusiforme G11]|uniref:Uncharacterized protein n=1 Tax=Cronartium quercuum f. sp. fusiforme G11 TaxID=708437 RepID=A0A9P6NBV2_9BASI|nr:hypothetical protein CROQUDRAFT_49331 [Cronartium quercuum f. sp. fusiforme G11]